MRTIGSVILKPTKGCNADCSYCSAPPDGARKWTFSDFVRVFDALEPRLTPGAVLIWHGGEPMLLGTSFYHQAYTYARERLPGIRFSMQSNMLAYNTRWNQVFAEVMHGSLSTSWDPDELHRTVAGSTATYSRVYRQKMAALLADGWQPKVISTFDEASMPLAHDVYDAALESDRAGRPYDIRLNYRYPAGRAAGAGAALSPESYGRVLLEVYDRWIEDAPGFLVTPLDQMLLKVVGSESGRCPWSKACTGHIVGIEPNFDVWNCGEFADTQDPAFRFGNLLDDGIEACLRSPAARALAMRRIRHPESCKTCVHFSECEGGCMRDSVIFDRGLYGKFFYCQSWQEVFSRIKESILTGEATRLLARLGHDPEAARSAVALRLGTGLAQGLTHMRRPVLSAGYVPDFATLHDPVEVR